MNRMLEHALKYAEMGFKVFPVRAKGKAPLSALAPHGFKDASDDPETIKRWWNQAPGANIGIATGLASDLFVFDVDIDNEKNIDGEKALVELEQKYGSLNKQTLTAKTGRGGTHYYFKPADGQRTPNTTGGTARALAKGLDTKGDGGYIIAPPSQHENGNYYEWINDIPPATLPEPLWQALLNAMGDNVKAQSDTAPKPNHPIEEGSRNDSLYRLGCSMQSRGIVDRGIWEALKAHNQEVCDPPIEEAELRRIYQSIIEKPKGNHAPAEVKDPPVELVTIADTEKKTPEWLIEGFIPMYAITTLAGDGGSGKTTAWCNIAGGISSGKPTILDDDGIFFFREPMKVLFFSSEDSAEYTLVGRLEANGAKPENISHLPYTSDHFKLIRFSAGYLEKIIRESKPDLVIFDPLQGFLSRDTNMSSRNQMRDELENVGMLCAKYQTTAIIVMHTNKSQQTSGRGRMADSADIWDLARSCLLVGVDSETGHRYISQEKSNYSHLRDTVLFSIEQDGRVQFQGRTKKKDKDFQGQKMYETRQAPAKDEAMNEIIKYLEEREGAQLLSEMEEAMKVYGISANALKNAKQALKEDGRIKLEKGEGTGGKWTISLL